MKQRKTLIVCRMAQLENVRFSSSKNEQKKSPNFPAKKRTKSSDAMDGQVYHYRDKNGLECDAVIHLRNGAYGLVEIKIGGETLINEGAATLKALAAKIDTTRMKAPSIYNKE